MKIQQEGKEKRRTAEAELNRIENELKQKLLEIGRTFYNISLIYLVLLPSIWGFLWSM